MSLFFIGEDMLGTRETRVGCEDIGLDTLRGMYVDDPHHPLFFLVLLPVSFAIGNVDYLLMRVWRQGLPEARLRHGISPLVVSLWALFTFLSMMSLLQFGRAPISFAFKFVHVFFELANLMFFFLIWRWSAHATATMTLAFVGLASALSMPCENTYPLTAIGAVLDSVNFFVVFYQALRKRTALISLVAIAFGWHATYIWAYLLMSYTTDDPYAIVSYRIYGVVANCAAIHFATSALDVAWDDPDDDVTFREWLAPPTICVEDCDTLSQHDSALFHNDKEKYTLSEEGTLLPVGQRSTYLLFAATAISSGLCYVEEDTDGASVLYSMYGRIGELRVSSWDGVSRVVRTTRWNERMHKMTSWVVFVYLLALFYGAQPRLWVAAAAAWIGPTALGLALLAAAFRGSRDTFAKLERDPADGA